MKCLYCGKESWLPARMQRDPDFCSLAHREKYHNRFDLAVRCIGESSASVPKVDPAAAAETPLTPAESRETGSAPGSGARVESSGLPVNSAPILVQSSKATPPVDRPRHYGAAGLATEQKMPSMAGSPVFDRVEEADRSVPKSQKRDERAPEFAGMFTMAGNGSAARCAFGRHAIGAIAASVIVVLALWFGGDTGKPKTDPLKSAARFMAPSGMGSDAAGAAETVSSPPPIVRPGPSAFQHPVAWAQNASARRATTHLAESFERGMAAWGAMPHGWVPGWSRSPDGFVRPGQLALFQPTLGYTDYRMEFFGQIENRGMSWALRAKDTQNYYAVKVAIIEPGLRPVLSMVRYAVVRGQHGRKVTMPLSLMIHNGVPYHFSVEVKGSTYTASIEGQEVDSWSDESLPTGGVGFFSEAGERARIYWMKVSKNDDWLGWLCERIARSGEPREITWLGRPAFFGLPEHTAPGRWR